MSVGRWGGQGGGRDGNDLNEVWDCSSMGASERLALKKDGIEAGRTGLSVQDWRRHRGRQMDERTEHGTTGASSTRECEDRDSKTNAGSTGAYDRLRETTEETGPVNDGTFPTHEWTTSNGKRSLGSKRRVYIPDEHRDAKRYDKNHARKLDMITYNAMYAADGARIRDISQTFPWAVVGVQGARQRRDMYEPAYRTRKTGQHVVYDFPHGYEGRKKGGPPAGVAIFLPHHMAAYVSTIKYPKDKRLQGRAGQVRVKLPDGRDYTFLTVYARTEQPGEQDDDLNIMLWEWVENELRDIPARSTPVIFTDANGHTGRGPHQVQAKDERTRGIGTEGAQK